MENLYQLLIKRRFKGSLTTNCFVVPSSSFLHLLGRRFVPHPNTNKSLIHSSSRSCSLDDDDTGASSVVVTHDYNRVTNDLKDALKSFNVMIHKRPLPSVDEFTQLLHDVTQLKHYSCSLHLFKQMCALGVPVNTYTAAIAIECYQRLYRTKYGFAVFGSCVKQGVYLHASSYKTLKGFALNNTHLLAEQLFYDFIASYRLCELNLVTYKIMIHKRPLPSVVKFTRLLHDLTQLKHYSCSLHLFKQMCALGVPVNTYTAGIAIKCYHRLYRTKYGLAVLGSCLKQGVELHVSTYNTLLKGFALNNTHMAEQLFRDFISRYRLPQLNLASYKIMIKGLCKIGNHFTAIGLLRLIHHGSILDGGCKFDVVIYNTILDSLSNDMIYIDYVFQLFKEMVFHKAVPPNVDTYNSLIYNLSKLGRWDDVSRTLKQMEDANISPKVKTFNIIVDALCKQGKIDEARVVLDIMLETGGKYPPNIVTYNSLIDAYCWRNEVSEARKIYDSLASKCIKPNFVTQSELVLGYIIDQNYKELEAFNNGLKSPLFAFHIFMSARSVIYHDANISFPKIGIYRDILERSLYEEALVFFHLMDRNGLNLESEVYDVIFEIAIKHRKFDDARRQFHDLLVKGGKPFLFTYDLLIDGFGKAGLVRESLQLSMRFLSYYA